MPSYTLLILMLPVFQGCLVVRTPKCDCPLLAIDPDTMHHHVPRSLYRNLTEYETMAVGIKLDGCSVSMYCEEEGYSLVVFDNETATTFGAYPADGFCDPRTQKWQVDTETGFASFDRLYGLCVDYTFPRCHCYSELLDYDTVRSRVGYMDFYQSNVDYYKPSVKKDQNGCVMEYECEGDDQRLLFLPALEPMFIDSPPTLKCGRTSGNSPKWNLTVGDQFFGGSYDHLFMTCRPQVLGGPAPTLFPPVVPKCKCPATAMYNSRDGPQTITNDNLIMEFTPDRCEWNVTCRWGFLQGKIGDEFYRAPVVKAVCNPETNQWRIDASDGKLWDNVPLFEFMCYV